MPGCEDVNLQGVKRMDYEYILFMTTPSVIDKGQLSTERQTFLYHHLNTGKRQLAIYINLKKALEGIYTVYNTPS